ncbi:PAP2 superfamily protein [Actinopolymorpha cephalotaxi]|uniref:Membrane-associated phospholipid phosphatase n=1 Tax=Actinopolymorpha cephalotaxi TaxID=504797 RepID=A0A1I2YMS3_9ACTN|nr:phosphatase PAP2 family protein [Actinopolymorpha cephalotaxi]NYH86876.1 membrane-associated phospholipid phosphatase [Actinopolymorpha cephalotaxi]SFH26942.1 PAP2 superfamily protein [Actinopolymorpha cephalotaxi]
MQRLVKGLVAGWLLVLVLAQAAVLVLVWWIFIRTPHGQVLDASVLRASDMGRDRVDGLVTVVLDAVSLASLVVATAVVAFIAVVRRRIRLALVATVLVAGANLTCQVLKDYLIDRPDLGIPGTNIGAPNSMPSGHVTVAASIAVAAVLVLPPRLRGLAAILGAVYVSLTGIATLSAGWHRPSDALAALLIVGIWAAAAGYLLILGQRHEPVREPSNPHHRTVAGLALVGGAFLVVAVLAIGLADRGGLTPPVDLHPGQLAGAYVGGVSGVAGATCLALALVLSTLHRVVPDLERPGLVETLVENLRPGTPPTGVVASAADGVANTPGREN